MSAPMRFRRAGALARGYHVPQVDAFMARVVGGAVTSEQIRAVGFDLKFGGYDVDVVDAALDRLEDDAVAVERVDVQQGMGERAYVREVTGQAQVLRARLARPHGDRFARGSLWERSYDIEDVDVMCDEIAEYFDGVSALSPDDLRSAVFISRRGSRGYSERAVDRFMDRVVAVIGRVS